MLSHHVVGRMWVPITQIHATDDYHNFRSTRRTHAIVQDMIVMKSV